MKGAAQPLHNFFSKKSVLGERKKERRGGGVDLSLSPYRADLVHATYDCTYLTYPSPSPRAACTTYANASLAETTALFFPCLADMRKMRVLCGGG